MMATDRHSIPWVVGTLMVVLILAFSILAINVVAQTQGTGGDSDRKPLGPPKEPPQSQPACPTQFTDIDCTEMAYGSHPNDVGQAEGLAILDCRPKYDKCVIKQDAERDLARAQCEAVAGCKFTYTTIAHVCSQVQCYGTGVPGDQGPFNCWVSPSYDHQDYTCARPTDTKTTQGPSTGGGSGTSGSGSGGSGSGGSGGSGGQ